jgi:hypothetical protein
VSELTALIHAGREEPYQPKRGPVRCPMPPRERRELGRLLAEAKARVAQQEAVLRAEVEADRRRPWQGSGVGPAGAR